MSKNRDSFSERKLKLLVLFSSASLFITLSIVLALHVSAQDAHFHNAPASVAQLKNPYAGQGAAVDAGSKLYTRNCGSCHGIGGRGTGNVPPLSRGGAQRAPEGEVFWFITNGSTANGMPSWSQLPEQQRWQLVSYLKSLKTPTSEKAVTLPANYEPVKTSAP